MSSRQKVQSSKTMFMFSWTRAQGSR